MFPALALATCGASASSGLCQQGSPARVCACGCGEPITSTRENARFATDACRTRSWKERVGYTDQRRATAVRNGKPKKRRSPDLRVSFRKAVDAVASELERRGEEAPRTCARELLAGLLTERQRSALGEDTDQGAVQSLGVKRPDTSKSPVADAVVIVELTCVSRELERLAARRDELIDQALATGYSERAIGRAARMTGQAVNYRRHRG